MSSDLIDSACVLVDSRLVIRALVDPLAGRLRLEFDALMSRTKLEPEALARALEYAIELGIVVQEVRDDGGTYYRVVRPNSSGQGS